MIVINIDSKNTQITNIEDKIMKFLNSINIILLTYIEFFEYYLKNHYQLLTQLLFFIFQSEHNTSILILYIHMRQKIFGLLIPIERIINNEKN